MKILISANSIKGLEPQEKPYDVRDTRLNGFIVRVYPSGKMSYVCAYARGKRITIGSTEVMKAPKARDRAITILGEFKDGVDPALKKRKAEISNWGAFIEKEYGPFVQAHRKDGKATLARLISLFSGFDNLGLDEISADHIEKWRTSRVKQNRKPATINRDLAAIKSALSYALEKNLISDHPLRGVKRAKVDNAAKVRYLSIDEEKNLRNALLVRGQSARIDREKGNKWRISRGYSVRPSLENVRFTDHLEPVVLISLNTGIRRGELFTLTWQNVDLSRAVITVTGANAKSGYTRHIPLNQEALEVLQNWQKQTTASGLVFPGKDNKPMDNSRKSWAGVLKIANIHNFRWHDMRHHFASKLVMAGVDLNTVRELLGHSDLKMTLRYAHLSPGHRAAAVEKLNGGAPF